MNIQASLRYQLHEFKWAIVTYYAVVVLLFALTILLAFLSIDESAQINGFGTTSMIVLFVMGIVTCREPLRLAIQNGVSRRSYFFAHLLMTVVVCAILSVCDRGLQALAELIVRDLPQAHFTNLVTLIYPEFFADLGGFATVLWPILASFCAYLGSFAAGYLISLAYYRMGTLLKIIVSVGVPFLLVAGIPLLDFGVLNGAIAAFVWRVFSTVMGLESGNLIVAVGSLLALALILNGCCYLLLRRAPIK